MGWQLGSSESTARNNCNYNLISVLAFIIHEYEHSVLHRTLPVIYSASSSNVQRPLYSILLESNS
jgi:hypothetical protein